MDWGHPAPFYAPNAPLLLRVTNRPRANMSAGCFAVATVTTRGRNGRNGHYPRVVTVATVVTKTGVFGVV